jgi:hypothetical protein
VLGVTETPTPAPTGIGEATPSAPSPTSGPALATSPATAGGFPAVAVYLLAALVAALVAAGLAFGARRWRGA